VDVIRLHGCLSSSKCFACHRPELVTPVPIQEEGALDKPPRCVRCNGKLRAGQVWYGEDLPAGTWKSAVSMVRIVMFCSASEHPEWLPPLPIFQACTAGATVIQVNTADAGLRAPKEFMLIGKATACSVLRGATR
jgi:NAD-dependent deacetylase